MAISVLQQIPYFLDLNGLPLQNGSLFLGTVNLNPETNPITVYWDSAGTIPAQQPIKTINGVPVWNGKASKIYVTQDFSFTVRDSKNKIVISLPNSSNYELINAIINDNLSVSSGSGLIGFIQNGTGAITQTVQSKLRQFVTPEDFGCVGDGTTDDTINMQKAINACNTSGYGLYSFGKVYRLTTDLNFRNITIDFIASDLKVDNATAKMIIGGTASVAINPRQTFKSIYRNGGSLANPVCRIMGAKMQNISITYCDYLQLYADTSTGNNGPDYSIAYSTFNLEYVRKLELTNNLSTPNSSIQWINENTFNIKRITDSLVLSGTYQHNHNYFNTGTFEGGATLSFGVGASNVVWGARFEGGAIINFTAGTWGNKIVQSWESSQLYPMYDNSTQTTITDNGDYNIVTRLSNLMQRRTPILSINSRVCKVYTNIAGATANALSGNYSSIQGVDLQFLAPGKFHRNSFRLIFDSPLIPFTSDDAISFEADAQLFRPYMQIYDVNGNLLQSTNSALAGYDANAGTYLRLDGNFTWDGQGYACSANLLSSRVGLTPNTPVKFIRYYIRSGNSTTGVGFRSLGVHLISNKMGASKQSNALAQAMQPAKVTATPTTGFATEIGEKISNTAGGWFTATVVIDTTLIATVTAGATTINVANNTGLTAGSPVTILMDDGTYYQTTANIVGGAGAISITGTIPSTATSGNRVVANTWTNT